MNDPRYNLSENISLPIHQMQKALETIEKTHHILSEDSDVYLVNIKAIELFLQAKTYRTLAYIQYTKTLYTTTAIEFLRENKSVVATELKTHNPLLKITNIIKKLLSESSDNKVNITYMQALIYMLDIYGSLLSIKDKYEEFGVCNIYINTYRAVKELIEKSLSIYKLLRTSDSKNELSTKERLNDAIKHILHITCTYMPSIVHELSHVLSTSQNIRVTSYLLKTITLQAANFQAATWAIQDKNTVINFARYENILLYRHILAIFSATYPKEESIPLDYISQENMANYTGLFQCIENDSRAIQDIIHAERFDLSSRNEIFFSIKTGKLIMNIYTYNIILNHYNNLYKLYLYDLSKEELRQENLLSPNPLYPSPSKSHPALAHSIQLDKDKFSSASHISTSTFLKKEDTVANTAAVKPPKCLTITLDKPINESQTAQSTISPPITATPFEAKHNIHQNRKPILLHKDSGKPPITNNFQSEIEKMKDDKLNFQNIRSKFIHKLSYIMYNLPNKESSLLGILIESCKNHVTSEECHQILFEIENITNIYAEFETNLNELHQLMQNKSPLTATKLKSLKSIQSQIRCIIFTYYNKDSNIRKITLNYIEKYESYYVRDMIYSVNELSTDSYIKNLFSNDAALKQKAVILINTINDLDNNIESMTNKIEAIENNSASTASQSHENQTTKLKTKKPQNSNPPSQPHKIYHPSQTEKSLTPNKKSPQGHRKSLINKLIYILCKCSSSMDLSVVLDKVKKKMSDSPTRHHHKTLSCSYINETEFDHISAYLTAIRASNSHINNDLTTINDTFENLESISRKQRNSRSDVTSNAMLNLKLTIFFNRANNESQIDKIKKEEYSKIFYDIDQYITMANEYDKELKSTTLKLDESHIIDFTYNLVCEIDRIAQNIRASRRSKGKCKTDEISSEISASSSASNSVGNVDYSDQISAYIS